jgi:RNA polymerase sigma-70 factor, ECF subfamily
VTKNDVEASRELDGLRELNPQVLSAIHSRYYAEIFRYASYRLGDPNAAEDIAAETFLRLIEALHNGKGPKTSLRGWLMGTASHLVNDFFRKKYARKVETIHENIHSAEPGPKELFEQHERENRVREAMAELTEDQQHVLGLRFGGGWTIEMTATLMNKKPNAIKALQFRALKALRSRLTESPQ